MLQEDSMHSLRKQMQTHQHAQNARSAKACAATPAPATDFLKKAKALLARQIDKGGLGADTRRTNLQPGLSASSSRQSSTSAIISASTAASKGSSLHANAHLECLPFLQRPQPEI